MFFKLFGILDFITGIVLILTKFNIAIALAAILAIYLIVKGSLFLPDLVSILDIIAGVFMILAIFGFFNVLTWIFVVWLIQKGLFSLL